MGRATKLEEGSLTDFSALHQAYRHLTVEGGVGFQRNAKHSVQLMLPPPESSQQTESEHNTNIALGIRGLDGEESAQNFKARLLAVVSDFGSKGFPASLLRRRYSQVWRGSAFPSPADFGIAKKVMGLLELLR